MNWNSIAPFLRCLLLAGSALYFALILVLIKRRRLSVRNAIIWLFSAAVLLVFAVFPYVVLVLTDMLGMAVPINTVFLLFAVFTLLLLLSHSVALSGVTQRQTRLAQKNALLEKRVRALEEQLAALQGKNNSEL